jgi:hypothetical protein
VEKPPLLEGEGNQRIGLRQTIRRLDLAAVFQHLLFGQQEAVGQALFGESEAK